MSDRKCKSKISRSISVFFVGGLIFTAPCYAQTTDQPPSSGNLGTAQDCTQVQVDYSEDPTLTDAEKLALMDRALFQSLSRYDACANSSANTSGGGGGNGGGGDQEGESAGDRGQTGDNGRGMSTASDLQGTEQSTSETATSASGGSSVASSDLSGTEKPAQEPGAGEASVQANLDAEGADSIEEGDVENGSSDRQEAGTIDNGKIPDDIPPADNDSVLEAQIRQAAINEADPEIKAKLWDEYRRYKGLPTK